MHKLLKKIWQYIAIEDYILFPINFPVNYDIFMKNTAYTNSHKPVTPPDHVALTEETGTTNQA